MSIAYLAPQIFYALLYLELAFVTSVSIQLIYFLSFSIVFARKVKTTKLPISETPLSVVICAHDELTNLQELIPLLLQQTHTQFEVILVDDRSNDATRDWAHTYSQQDSRLRLVHIHSTPEHINGKKYALTLGIRAAQFDWIVLTDADCRPSSSQWLSTLNSAFSTETDFVLGYSPYQQKNGWLNRFIRFDTIITALQYLGFALLKIPYMGIGRNMAYRKSVFMNNKGFTNMLSTVGGDDDLFVNRHATSYNTGVVLQRESTVFSIPKNTWGDFFHQKIRHLAAGKSYRILHRMLLASFMLSWVLTWFLGVPLLLISHEFEFIGMAMGLRIILFLTALHFFTKKTGHSFESWSLVLLDIIYTIYYLTTGTAALLTKKIKWKN